MQIQSALVPSHLHVQLLPLFCDTVTCDEAQFLLCFFLSCFCLREEEEEEECFLSVFDVISSAQSVHCVYMHISRSVLRAVERLVSSVFVPLYMQQRKSDVLFQWLYTDYNNCFY